ncbi:MAG: ATP-binding protein [Bacilli bacterium]|nr:ATP-binding protein [Bacilli bacterium]
MLGHILEINDNCITVELAIDINEQPNLIGLHTVFENDNKKIVGEIVNINQTKLIANIVGELTEDSFVPGSSYKPSFKSNVRLVKTEELEFILGEQTTRKGTSLFGTSNIYENYKINVNTNDFFSNHFSILGNSGSGKSCTVASIIQNLFSKGENPPLNSNIMFFDAFGEYTQAFSKLNNVNANINYKVYTTNQNDGQNETIRIPVWLLDVDDLALLLNVTTPTQLPIIEKTLKLVPILTGNSAEVIKRKNDIIARALLDILLSGNDSTKIRDQVTAVLTKFNTNELNLESKIAQPGYVRTLKQCLYIDKTGKMQEMELVVEFIRTYVSEEIEEIDPNSLTKFYTLSDLENAMDFALISEGILKSEKVFDYANVISVRLHALVNGEYKELFNYPKYITKEEYIKELTTNKMNGGKCQIVNFNISYVDDRIAKVITKIISRMLFTKVVSNSNRGSEAYHIIVEEAHRYIQRDTDIEILGYNIFERITKEGRKYGIFLGVITQRPSELSDTVISQCSNFLILRILHPKDLDYIKNMVPSISSEIVLQLKNLKPGNCIAFGSAFKVPTAMYIPLANPRPLSDNVNLEEVWYKNNDQATNEINSMLNNQQSNSINTGAIKNVATQAAYNNVINQQQVSNANVVTQTQVNSNIANQQFMSNANNVSNQRFINTNNTVNN